MPKPIVINTAILARNRDGSYALDLMQDDGRVDHVHRFQLTEEAAEQLKADCTTTPNNFGPPPIHDPMGVVPIIGYARIVSP